MKIFALSTQLEKTSCLRLALAYLLLAAQSVAFAQQPRPAQTPPARPAQTPPGQTPPKPAQTSPAQTPPTQVTPSQQQQQQQEDALDEVLRVSTSLVQTDVSVVDKKGQFVGGLQRDQFELKVDGRVQPVLFFERITAGSASESARIAAARGETTTAGRAVAPLGAGRAVVFFVDDLHLSSEGIQRARELINNFIEREMSPGIQALISSASGQIGFLQQFTNERAVLRAAASRIKYVSQAGLDNGRPPMSGYQAELIDRGDKDMLDYMVNQTLDANGQRYDDPGARSSAEITVKNRARVIRRQAAQLGNATVASLESVVRAPSPYGGRQTLFFISEGFTPDAHEGDIPHKITRVLDVAARTGTVVYSIYSRGLTVGMQDASSGAGADLADLSSGTGQRGMGYRGYNPSLEVSAMQDVLRGLAEDTGGRAFINTNALDRAVAQTLEETANYYLLAWRPEGVEVKDGAPRFRKIEISVKGRPDLKVRVRRGFLATTNDAATRPAAATNTATTPAAVPKAALNGALNSLNSRRDLPVDAYVVFTNDAQGGSVVNASVQVANDRLKFAPAAAGGKTQAQVEVVCAVLDERGKSIYSTGRTLTLDANNTATNTTGASRGKLVTNFSIPVPAPGLYQVRTAARDAASGILGSAFEWVEVPDLKTNRLALSSLLVTEKRRAAAAAGTQAAGAAAAATTNATTKTAATNPASAGAASRPTPDILRVERRFARSSHLLLQLYIYNAARAAAGGAPDVELEIKILRDNKVVLNAPAHKVSLAPGSDAARIFYAAEVPLAAMQPGIYWLQVTATDRSGRTTSVRELDFSVE
ncbi:MAG TPA: VWA domain-containing protein [Pyrinomonadaceae bacterium]|jgi:VWFA-related protein